MSRQPTPSAGTVPASPGPAPAHAAQIDEPLPTYASFNSREAAFQRPFLELTLS